MTDSLPFNNTNLPDFYTPDILEILNEREIEMIGFLWREYTTSSWHEIRDIMRRKGKDELYMFNLQHLFNDKIETGLSEKEYVLYMKEVILESRDRLKKRYPDLNL